MKKGLFLFVFILYRVILFGQEIQLHFDPRHTLHNDVASRNYVTITFQGSISDKLDSTYGFIDMDFNQSKGNIELAYLGAKWIF